MNSKQIFTLGATAFVLMISLIAAASAATGVQVGPSGQTYASSSVRCALNPVTGMAPLVQAGLNNPATNSSAVVSLNGNDVASVTYSNPNANVWLANGSNTVVVTVDKNTADSYTFDASLSYPNQPNMCIPDTSANTINGNGDLEYAASNKSYVTVTFGCAVNPRTGQPQPFINLFDNGTYILNVSVNNVPLTQLNATRTHTPIFLSAGLNVISAANGYASTDYYVRNGGDGTCTLP